MHDSIEDHPIEAVDFLIDLDPLNPDSPSVVQQLIGQFVDRDDIGLCRLWDVVCDPLIQEVDAACAHVATSSREALGSSGPIDG